MGRLQQFRKSAIFIDIILVAGAIIAIIGLAAFVHLRGLNKSSHAEKPTLHSSGAVYAEPLQPDPSPPNSPESNASDASSNPTPSPAACQNDCTQPENPAENMADGALEVTCDQAKKLLLLAQYSRDVIEENKAYQKSLTLLSAPLSLAGNTLSSAASLLSGHEAKLSSLKSAANTQLKLLKCPNDLL